MNSGAGLVLLGWARRDAVRRRVRGRRELAGVVVTVLPLVATLLVLPAQQATAAAAESEASPLPQGQEALAQARQSGQRVEVSGERTERTTVYANPDGYTFTLEESVVPVRVAKPSGGWQAPDATLEKRSDGSVGPKAAAAEMSFSGGGRAVPLASIADQGRSLALTWPGELPVPALEGASAVYADVLPGVDLKVTATPESFQPVFVVKTPEAAAGEELKKLTFGLKTEGLEVHEGPLGNLAAVDGGGRTVFKAPPARMWDSAGAASAPQTQLALRRAAGADEGEPSDPSESAPSGSGVEPGQGDTVARMDVEVGEDKLSVVPDARMLNRTGKSAFPVFIDPTVTWGESERTLLRSDGYESYGWGNGDDGEGKGSGKCGSWNGYYCGPGYVQKLYFEFSPSSLKGKKVLDATFRVTEPWAFQCDPRLVDLVRTDNISSSTTWSTRPKELDWMVDRSVSAGRGSMCDPDSPDAPIEFHDSADEPDENLTPTVRDFAAGKFSRLTLEVRAHDESDASAWKRFKDDAVLAVDFVGLPDKATGVGLNVDNKPMCSTSSTDPLLVSAPTPSLMATAQTQSGGEQDAQLRVNFDISQRRSDGTWSDTSAGNGDLRPSTGYVGDGVKTSLTWSALTEGTLYRYQAVVRSYYNGGKDYLSGPSSASTTGWCYFKVDPTAPKAPQVSISSPYTECTTNVCAAGGSPGRSATVTFKAAAGDTNNVAYEYSLNSGSNWASAKKVCRISQYCQSISESSPLFIGWQAVITPDHAGTYHLAVRARDKVGSGRAGAWKYFDFAVHDGTSPVGRWHFSEAGGDAIDSSVAAGTTGHNATLTGGATRDDRGRRGLLTRDAQGRLLDTPVTDKGLSLNGTTAYAATTEKVLDTSSSYTVSAWMRVDSGVSHTLTVLSQTPESASPFSQKFSPFLLSYAGGGDNTWSVRVMAGDGSFHEAKAQQATPRGAWTHVAAVFDADNKKIGLYLNGALQSTVDSGAAWKATGPLQFGRAMYADNYVDYFQGDVDEVATWQRALTSTEIADEAKLLTSQKSAGVELVADWSADQGSGISVPDTASGYGRSLTLSGGASLDGESVVLDGVDGAASTAGPVVDDSGSFTVTTLVSLDGEKLAAKPVGYTAQVLGQRTADGSAWGLWYQVTDKKTVLDEDTLKEKTVPVGLWRFGRLNADGSFSAVSSEDSALVDGMVRLTGVFDAQAGEISLYLGGNPSGDGAAFTAKAGSGDFAVGKGFTKSTWQHYLPGRVAEARLWAGAMAGWEQVGESVGD
ncbi:LamG domain-containing protein [Streptomyces sp. NPDC048664]|uniref:LamG domain-containing protein n=1 Tax=Streptomyces sp. NPDC048664 TaxID=3154505 RepID=UPI003447EE8E